MGENLERKISPLMRFQIEIWKMLLQRGEKVFIGDHKDADGAVYYELALDENNELYIKNSFKVE